MKPREKFRPRGSGSIFERGNVLWIRYYQHGRGFSESTHSHSREKAKAMLKARLSEIETGVFSPQRQKIRVADLMAVCIRDYEINLKKSIYAAKLRWRVHLAPVFEHFLAASVTSDSLQKYVEQRLKEGAEPATVNRELALLKRAFSLALESTPPKLRFIPKFPHLKENNIREGFVNEEQADKIGAECAKVGLWMSGIFWLLFEFGFRVSEALNLRVSQIDLANRSIDLNPGQTKSGEGRVAIMTGRVYELIKALTVGKQSHDLVFTRASGAGVGSFRKAWAHVTKDAGVPNLLVHDLRRSAVRRMIRRGISRTVAMKISGHKTESVFRRYDIVEEADLRDAAAKLETKPSLDTIELQSGHGKDVVPS